MNKITSTKSILEILDTTSKYSRESIERKLQLAIDSVELDNESLLEIYKEYGEVILSLNNSQTNGMVLNLVEEKYRPMLQEMIQSICRDYNCKNIIEISMAQNIATSYVRGIVLQDKINDDFQGDGLLSNLRNSRLSILSKELDRANRQYITFIKTLRELKRPQLSVIVNVESMIVGNNNSYLYKKHV